MNEIWKDIFEYEGKYQISNYGKVKSVGHIINYKNGRTHKWSEHFLTIGTSKKGYKTVALWKNNKEKRLYVHRLVAEAFIPNPGSKPQINHKDGNKANNHVDNLEWCTPQENGLHRYRVLKKLAPTGAANKLSKAVIQIKRGVQIKTFGSIAEAETETHCNGISLVCRGIRKTSRGFEWKYKN